MDDSMDISLFMMISTTLVLFLIIYGAMIRSVIKYKYSAWWLLLAALLFACPPLIFVLFSFCERVALNKDKIKKEEIKGKIKVRIAIASFIFYYLLLPLFVNFLKYSSANQVWYSEMASVCVNIVMIALVPFYVYIKKQIHLLNINN
ncbi:MAG: hypothetical protein LBH32_11245 [Dysgonamonadaceae bacterium]|jgi:hypothetical protein|nr:hypothetical protein [Dysgonamonadaceae bacterium]